MRAPDGDVGREQGGVRGLERFQPDAGEGHLQHDVQPDRVPVGHVGPEVFGQGPAPDVRHGQGDGGRVTPGRDRFHRAAHTGRFVQRGEHVRPEHRLQPQPVAVVRVVGGRRGDDVRARQLLRAAVLRREREVRVEAEQDHVSRVHRTRRLPAQQDNHQQSAGLQRVPAGHSQHVHETIFRVVTSELP